ncbi:MAG TPA: MmgE/PrpD family protein [Chloroflexota bacterium]|nr:MmgE/PrpD family protein [Chloroflexota bacterium]
MAVVAQTATPVTQLIASFACDHDLSEAPTAVFERARRAVLDTLGVAIAARLEPSFTILARTIGHGTCTGDATVLATRIRTQPAQAAFLNGTAGHALDFDDVADEIKGHPSVVLVPALLALAEVNGNSGRELLEAYVVGFEVACAIARGLPIESHYRRGWHATATIGVLAATCGAGRLLGLDEVRMRHALGIAGSMASGSRQNFGTMTKPLHAGMAARDAVIAAQLAANGFTADQDQLEGSAGYFALYGVDANPAAVALALAGPRVLVEHGLNAKKYACCYETHRAADAALVLYERGLRAWDVRSVALHVQPGGMQAIIHHRPTTGLQGKFSAEYVVAACLIDGRLSLSTFTDEAVQRPEALELVQRIVVQEAAEPPFGPSTFEHAYATIEVTLGDGSRLRERCDVPRGHALAPLTDAELDAKFRDCLEFSESDWDTDELLHRLRGLSEVSRVADVMA